MIAMNKWEREIINSLVNGSNKVYKSVPRGYSCYVSCKLAKLVQLSKLVTYEGNYYCIFLMTGVISTAT